MNVSPATGTQTSTQHDLCIRLLATTDLHGHLLPHDYIKDQPAQDGGLAGLASLITQARAQALEAQMPVVLLDNGDTFQGTPLASDLATREVGADHPIVAAMNHLRYDALGLGNHDLDHGLPYLKAVACALKMPMLNSNLRNIDIAPLQHSMLLPIETGADAPAPLTLGILSVLPMQSAAWQSHHLDPKTKLDAPDKAIRATAAALRQQGADLIVALGHMGVGHEDCSDSDISAAHALVRTGMIDALILGHTHRRLPSTDYAARKHVDIHTSTISGVPALMAGHAGSDLGVMDLALRHSPAKGWEVCAHRCALRPNGATVTPDPKIVGFATAAHDRVRQELAAQVATTEKPLHSYFSLVSPAPTQHLTATAQYHQITEALRGSADAALPLLSCAAAHGAGGRDGPANYIHIPEGPVLRRHIAGLNPFANQTVGIRISGANLHRWLEHAALLFNTLSKNSAAQMLINTSIPAFQFDTIFGLHYVINPAASPSARVSEITHNGKPVSADQMFILATNQFRATGGGGYPMPPTCDIACRVDTPLQDTMIEILGSKATPPWGAAAPWRFASLGGKQAIILTHPDALERVEDIAHLHPKLEGSTPEGFIRLSITL